MALPTEFPAFVYKRGEGVSSGVLVNSLEEMPAGDWVDAPSHNDTDKFTADHGVRSQREAKVERAAEVVTDAALHAEIAKLNELLAAKDTVIKEQGDLIAALQATVDGSGEPAPAANPRDGEGAQTKPTAKAKK